MILLLLLLVLGLAVAAARRPARVPRLALWTTGLAAAALGAWSVWTLVALQPGDGRLVAGGVGLWFVIGLWLAAMVALATGHVAGWVLTRLRAG